MTIEEFLAQLNIAHRGWGLWIDRNDIHQYHIGQYAFQNDRIPKSFIHVDNLDHLAHLRQRYIQSRQDITDNVNHLGWEWAKHFLAQWYATNCRILV